MLESYKELVSQARFNNQPRVLENSAPEHAKILIQNLIESATDKKRTEDIKIVAGNFRHTVYDEDVIEAAKNAMKSGVKIHAIATEIDELDISDNPFAKLISDSENGTLNCAKDVFDQVPHLVLVGDQKYRLEPNSEFIKAVASFNDKSTAKTVASLFMTISTSVRSPTSNENATTPLPA